MILEAPLHSRTALRVCSRVAAALLGGWFFTWGFTAFGIAGLVALGLRYDEARTALYLVAFLVFLGVLLWALAAASATRVWLVLAGGGAAMATAAWALTTTLLAT
jgi:hypothetical protein